MKFTDQDHQTRSSRPNRRSPGVLDATWLRLACLVGLLVFVIWAMNAAGKPENWAWMGFENLPEKPPEKLAPPAQGDPIGEPNGDRAAPVQPRGDTEPSIAQKRDELDQSGFQIATHSAGQFDFWQSTLKKMSRRQRAELFSVLRELVAGRLVDDGNRSSAGELGAWLDDQRQRYHARILELVGMSNDLTAGEQARLSRTLFELQQKWSAFHAAWKQATAGQQLDSDARATMRQTSELLDQVALVQIKDRTTVGRAIEAPAWLGLFGKLVSATHDEIQSQSLGPVSMAQLLSQPAVFRGRLVTVSGTAVQGQRITAGPNDLGIEQYYTLWIRPRTPANVPFSVYALELPDGFPPIGDRAVELDQSVEVSGYLFKTRLFASSDGPAECPLILARMPIVPEAAPRIGGPKSVFSAPVFAMAVAAAAAVGILVAIFAFRVSFRRRRSATSDQRVKQELNQLQENPQIETVQQRLGRLAKTDLESS